MIWTWNKSRYPTASQVMVKSRLKRVGGRTEQTTELSWVVSASALRNPLCVGWFICVCVWFEGMGDARLQDWAWCRVWDSLPRPPKWQKTCVFAADPYTLTEHFLNLSCVFLRPKRISSLSQPPFETLHPPQASLEITPTSSTYTHLTISTFLLPNKDSMQAVWPVKAYNLKDTRGEARQCSAACSFEINTQATVQWSERQFALFRAIV